MAGGQRFSSDTLSIIILVTLQVVGKDRTIALPLPNGVEGPWQNLRLRRTCHSPFSTGRIVIAERVQRLTQATRAAAELLRAAARFEDVANAVLEKVASAVCCASATYWTADYRAHALRSTAIWHCLGAHERRLARSRPTFIQLAGLGKAAWTWRTRKPAWSSDLLVDLPMPNALYASQAGLGGGLWLAVKTDTALYGVVELLTHTPPRVTLETLATVERIGFRLGCALEELPPIPNRTPR